MNWHLDKKTSLVYAVAFLIVFCIALFSLLSIKKLIAADKDTSLTYETIGKLESIVSHAKDIETGYRGYALTGKENFLEPYYSGINLIKKEIIDAKALIKESIQKEELDSLDELVNQKILFAQQQVSLRKINRETVVMEELQMDKGKIIMDSIRKNVNNIIIRERKQLQQRSSQSIKLSHYTLWFIFFGGIVVVLFVLLGIYRINNAISKLRNTENVLHLSEARLNEAQKISHLGSWELTIETCKLELSDEIYKIFEKESKNLTYQDLASKIHPDDIKIVKNAIRANDGNSYSVNFRILMQDNTVKYVHGHGYTLFNKTGDPVKHIGTIQDVTRQKLIEEELIQAKGLAEQSAKIKEQFLANMSHEIRTPLNGIIGFTELLEDTPLNVNQSTYLGAIKNSGKNLLMIINDILDFSKIEADKVEFEEIEIDLRDMLGSIILTFQSAVKVKNNSIELNFDKSIPTFLLGDPLRLSQILINLIGNAIKFSNQNGIINVVVKALSNNTDTIEIEFAVQDTGMGISEDRLTSIFEDFTQANVGTTRKFGGTGLGLAIAKKLVELQGGRIGVKSRLNEGSIFSFNLPFKNNNRETLKKADIHIKTEQLEQNFKGLKILVVEDNPMNQLLAKTVLSKWGIEVTIAENGKIAVKQLQTNDYDIVFMDLQMPEMDGYEATSQIRKVLKKEVTIIAMTANAVKGEAERCLHIGMNDYISKPIDIKILQDKIKLYC
jgi:signal transduction histidine kinase/CheY-like chemotaxis protein/CHASE3 domain sensor protein